MNTFAGWLPHYVISYIMLSHACIIGFQQGNDKTTMGWSSHLSSQSQDDHPQTCQSSVFQAILRSVSLAIETNTTPCQEAV